MWASTTACSIRLGSALQSRSVSYTRLSGPSAATARLTRRAPQLRHERRRKEGARHAVERAAARRAASRHGGIDEHQAPSPGCGCIAATPSERRPPIEFPISADRARPTAAPSPASADRHSPRSTTAVPPAANARSPGDRARTRGGARRASARRTASSGATRRGRARGAAPAPSPPKSATLIGPSTSRVIECITSIVRRPPSGRFRPARILAGTWVTVPRR